MIPLLAAAFAQDLVTYDAKSIVQHGTPPTITFQIQESGHFRFTVACGPKKSSVPKASYSAGAKHTLELTGVPMGDHQCAGAIDAEMPDGRSGTLPFKLNVRSLKPLSWVTNDEDYSAGERRLTTSPSRPLQTATAKLIGADGAVIETVYADLEDPAHAVFKWTSPDEVLQIVVDATDTLGATSTLTLSPWSYRIPHDDIVFASGDATITDAEAHKLEATWADIERVLAKYGAIVKIQLFVAGYTDTVGPAANNVALSQRRARSIAAWFQQRGFSGPIHYQGFGESVLADPTGDEVDNASNRRALYVLAAAPPQKSDAIPRSNWSAL